MSPVLLLLCADMLDKAGDHFGNHGCNDLELPKAIRGEDLDALAEMINRWNFQANPSARDKAQPDDLETAKTLRRGSYDWMIMHALAFGLRELATKEKP